MAGFDGSGNFTKSISWVEDKNNNIKVNASRHDTVDNEFISGHNLALTRDGQGTPTAILPMNGFKHTGVANATATDEYTALNQIQDQDGIYVVSTGSANAYILGTSPAITAYVAGQRFVMNANFTNTASATVNVSGLGAKTLKFGGGNLLAGDIQSGQLVEIIYDGTNFEVNSSLNNGAHNFRASMATQLFS